MLLVVFFDEDHWCTALGVQNCKIVIYHTPGREGLGGKSLSALLDVKVWREITYCTPGREGLAGNFSHFLHNVQGLLHLWHW